MVSDHGRLLLVEDNSNDVELVFEALAGFSIAERIDVVRDGEEALDYLHRRGGFANRIDAELKAIIIDIKLPKITGLEVLRHVRFDEELRLIPVVVFSSSRERRDLLEAYSLGANAYVVKPAESSKLFEAVKALGVFWGVFNEPPLLNA